MGLPGVIWQQWMCAAVVFAVKPLNVALTCSCLGYRVQHYRCEARPRRTGWEGSHLHQKGLQKRSSGPHGRLVPTASGLPL
jgi:hypothetical protein